LTQVGGTKARMPNRLSFTCKSMLRYKATSRAIKFARSFNGGVATMKPSSVALGTIAALVMTPIIAQTHSIGGWEQPKAATGTIVDSHGAVLGPWYPDPTASLEYVLLSLNNNKVMAQVNVESLKGGADNLYYVSEGCSGPAYIAQVYEGDEFDQAPLEVSNQETFSHYDEESGFGGSPLYYANLAAGTAFVTVCSALNTHGDCDIASAGGCTSIIAYPALSYDWSHLAFPLKLQ
jgi:hypothetical protein